MYGIVNKAIQGLITENFGEESWIKVKEKSGVRADQFLNSELYDDSVTYKLAGAASEVLNLPLSQVLMTFGEYWILKTGKQSYGHLMEAGGSNLKEFLINLPSFHTRVMLMYPDVQPPEFKITNIENNSLHLHYFSEREGLQDFMYGLLLGLGKMFEIPVDVKLLQNRNEGYDHEIYAVAW